MNKCFISYKRYKVKLSFGQKNGDVYPKQKKCVVGVGFGGRGGGGDSNN